MMYPNTSKTFTIRSVATVISAESVQTTMKRHIDSVDQVSTKSWELQYSVQTAKHSS
jgi:hypothetical protein